MHEKPIHEPIHHVIIVTHVCSELPNLTILKDMQAIQKEVQKAKKIHEVFIEFDHWFRSPVIFLMRVIWGFLFILEGWYKFSDISSHVSYFADLGFSYPTLMVYLAASAELFGGFFMVLGFLTRLTMIPLMITMLVAAVMDPSHASFWGHGSGQTETFLAQIPLVFFYACLITFVFGPGKWSVDYKLKDCFFLCQ